jgi:hypothetical protein
MVFGAELVDVKTVGVLLMAVAVAVAYVVKVYLENKGKKTEGTDTDKRIEDLWNWHKPDPDSGTQTWKRVPAEDRERMAKLHELERLARQVHDMVDDLHGRSSVTDPGKD